jgi:hypothetical protein
MSKNQQYTSHSGFDQRINVATSQAVALPKGYTQLYQRTPFNTSVTWGSISTVTFRTKNVSIADAWIEFTLASGISDLTLTSSGTAGLLPAQFWATRIEVIIGSVVIDTIFPLNNFLEAQVFAGSDEKRTLANTGSGIYNNHASRATRTATGQVWYLPLKTFLAQGQYPILAGSPDIELRVTMNTLADSYSISAGSTESGTPAQSGFSSVNLVTRHSVLPAEQIAYHTNLLKRSPLHFPFLETRTQTIPVPSGSSTITAVLSGITGTACALLFAVRPANPTKGSQIAFESTVTSWELLSNASQSLVGGQPITDALSRFIISQQLNTTFFTEVGAGVYCYSWSHDLQSSFDSGLNLSTYTFRGSEQLRLTLSSALGANAQIDVMALTYSAIEMSGNTIRKISLTHE